MTESPHTLLARWPSPEELAADIDASVSAVRKWAQRDSIPVGYWSALVASAGLRGVSGVTFEGLALMHARRLPDDLEPANSEARS